MLRGWRKSAAIAALAAFAVALSGIATASTHRTDAGQPATSEGRQTAEPNIVYVLTDDMSADLLRYMTEVDKLRSEGTTMENYIYGDSLCCPSRATILTGKFPHNSGVLTNIPKDEDGDGDPDGGLQAFRSKEASTFAVALQKAGYRTGMMGKYLNGYQPGGSPAAPELYVPPGWDEWHVAGEGGYSHTDYTMTRGIDGATDHQTEFEEPYLTDTVANKAETFLDRAVTDHPDDPFFLHISTFAPHSQIVFSEDLPFVPAPRDRANPETGFPGDCGPADCTEVRAPRGGAFDQPVRNAPEWMPDQALTQEEIDRIDQKYVLRVQMMQSVNDMIQRIRTKLDELDVADNTYIVFGSDNGFHLGEHRQTFGKRTVHDYDSVVPLVVAGPDVEAGATRDELVQNVDMYRSFLDMAGVTDPAPSNGRSMLGLLEGGSGWARDAAFMEHTDTTVEVSPAVDPDADPEDVEGNAEPGNYTALRTADEIYTEYATGEVEYYDLSTDPHHLNNTAADLTDQQRELFSGWVDDLANCGKGEPTLACWDAGRHPEER